MNQGSAKSVQNIILFWTALLRSCPCFFSCPQGQVPDHSPVHRALHSTGPSQAIASPFHTGVFQLPEEDMLGVIPLLAYLAWGLWRDLILDPEEEHLHDC